MRFFWVGVYEKPCIEDEEKGVEPKVLVSPKAVLAPDADTAKLLVARDVPVESASSRIVVECAPLSHE